MTLPSGSSGGDFVQVQVLLPAPKTKGQAFAYLLFFSMTNYAEPLEGEALGAFASCTNTKDERWRKPFKILLPAPKSTAPSLALGAVDFSMINYAEPLEDEVLGAFARCTNTKDERWRKPFKILLPAPIKKRAFALFFIGFIA